jgi:hypothetical protein
VSAGRVALQGDSGLRHSQGRAASTHLVTVPRLRQPPFDENSRGRWYPRSPWRSADDATAAVNPCCGWIMPPRMRTTTSIAASKAAQTLELVSECHRLKGKEGGRLSAAPLKSFCRPTLGEPPHPCAVAPSFTAA